MVLGLGILFGRAMVTPTGVEVSDTKVLITADDLAAHVAAANPHQTTPGDLVQAGSDPLPVPMFLAADVPAAASYPWCVIAVTDGDTSYAAGLWYSNGSAWVQLAEVP